MTAGKGKGKGKDKDKDNGKPKKSEEIVHKYSAKGQGPLREAVIIAGIPYFIKRSFNEKRDEYVITNEPYIEEATKILRPPFVEECPYIPYDFKTTEEPNRYLQRVSRGETIDSLYQKVKSYVRLFNDVEEHTLNLLSADIVGSYFQDRYSTVHYLNVLGENGTGKSAFGDTFECLGYRAVNMTVTCRPRPVEQCAICGNKEFWEVTDQDLSTKKVRVSEGKDVKYFAGRFKKTMCKNCMNIQEYFEMDS